MTRYELFRVKLDGNGKRVVRPLDGLDDSIGSTSGHDEARRNGADGLMVQAIDREVSHPEYFGRPGVTLNHDLVRHRGPGVDPMGHAARNLARDVLVKRPTHRDVQHL